MKILKSVIIIDDDDIFVYLTRKAIQQANITDDIKSFGNGLDALAFLKENWANPSLLPELIFLDLSMPVMDGWQFLQEYSALVPLENKIILYILTSSISPEDIERSNGIDAVSDMLIKPITKEKLLEVLKNL